jgi:hypothetical protein
MVRAMIQQLAAWLVSASIYHATVLDPAHGRKMPLPLAVDIAGASVAHPLFPNGIVGTLRTAALLLVFSANESLHTMDLPPTPDPVDLAFAPFGIHNAEHHDSAAAISIFRWSRESCGDGHPWARYAGGCNYLAAKNISDARQAIADELLRVSGVQIE